MSLMTTWGYAIEDAEELTDLLTVEEFNVITANKYAGDARIQEAIKAASMAIRNYCGWHIFPQLACICSERILSGDGRLKRAGADILIQLPASIVTGVSSVAIDGNAFTDFAISPNGLLRLFDVYRFPTSRRTEIAVEYTAGLPDRLTEVIKELAAGRITRALSGTAGIASESAGGVSVSYSSGWTNGGGAGALQSTDVETLEPYKLRGVF